MQDDVFHVLWVCGPAGVGKSTVSWQLFTELADAGVRVAFADTDQLGMCHPAGDDARGRQRVKLANIAAMIPNYRAAGAQYAIINGVIDPSAGLPARSLPGSVVTICRLRASPEEVERRFLARSDEPGDVTGWLSEVREEAVGFDHSSFADACVDTTGVAPADVAALVRDACKAWPGFSADRAADHAADRAAARTQRSDPAGTGADGTGGPAAGADGAGAHGDVMLIAGPTGVGKSTIGFRVYVNLVTGQLGAGYVDLEQVGFIKPAPADALQVHRLRARNLAAIWQNYRAEGATHLVATGPVEDRAALQVYADEMPAATVRLCRLRAGHDQLSQRIASRGAGGSWPQPGDPLRGQPADVLRAAATRAALEAAALDRSGTDGLVIDTDRLAADETADLIARAAGWPGQQKVLPAVDT